MRILLVDPVGKVPFNSISAAMLMRWSLINGLLAHECEVGYLLFKPERARDIEDGKLEASRALLTEMGCRFWSFNPCSPEEQQDRVRAIVAEFFPDAVLFYEPEAHLLSAVKAGSALRVPMFVDLYHLPGIYRFLITLRYAPLKYRMVALRGLPQLLVCTFKTRRLMLARYSQADLLINHAAHHARWLERKLHKPCLYVPNPVAALKSPRQELPLPNPAPFLLLGALWGISTQAGLHFFAAGVIPHLQTAIRAGQIELEIVGGGTLPQYLADELRSRGVVFRGFVEDLELEYDTARAMVVPASIKLGFRTRILDAFRHKLCVITHQANAAGMPELQHGHNCLLAKNGREMATQMLDVAGNDALRRQIARQGYEDFQSKLSAVRVSKQILDFLESRK